MSRVRVLLNSPINRAPVSIATTDVGSFVSSFSLSFVRIPVVLSLFLLASPRRGREQLPPGSRRIPFIFYHRASSPLARLRVPPSLRLQVARNSLQPPPQPLRISSFSFSSYLTVRPSVRSSEVRKYRLVCPMTRRLLLLLVSSIFFPPSRENFFSRCRVSSLSSPRVHRSPSPSLSPFSF